MTHNNKQAGFTLIEIVMVLVLIGILGAVAVPKYFDLQTQAQQKAAAATVAEVQATINGAFADSLLKGNTCTTAQTAAKDAVAAMKFNGDITAVLGDVTEDANVYKVTVKYGNTPVKQTGGDDFTVGVPQCN